MTGCASTLSQWSSIRRSVAGACVSSASGPSNAASPRRTTWNRPCSSPASVSDCTTTAPASRVNRKLSSIEWPCDEESKCASVSTSSASDTPSPTSRRENAPPNRAVAAATSSATVPTSTPSPATTTRRLPTAANASSGSQAGWGTER